MTAIYNQGPATTAGYLQEKGIFSKANTIGGRCQKFQDTFSRVTLPMNAAHLQKMQQILQGLFDDMFGKFVPNSIEYEPYSWFEQCNKKPDGKDAEMLFNLVAPNSSLSKVLQGLSIPNPNFADEIRSFWKNADRAKKKKTGTDYLTFDVPLPMVVRDQFALVNIDDEADLFQLSSDVLPPFVLLPVWQPSLKTRRPPGCTSVYTSFPFLPFPYFLFRLVKFLPTVTRAEHTLRQFLRPLHGWDNFCNSINILCGTTKAPLTAGADPFPFYRKVLLAYIQYFSPTSSPLQASAISSRFERFDCRSDRDVFGALLLQGFGPLWWHTILAAETEQNRKPFDAKNVVPNISTLFYSLDFLIHTVKAVGPRKLPPEIQAHFGVVSRGSSNLTSSIDEYTCLKELLSSVPTVHRLASRTIRQILISMPQIHLDGLDSSFITLLLELWAGLVEGCLCQTVGSPRSQFPEMLSPSLGFTSPLDSYPLPDIAKAILAHESCTILLHDLMSEFGRSDALIRSITTTGSAVFIRGLEAIAQYRQQFRIISSHLSQVLETWNDHNQRIPPEAEQTLKQVQALQVLRWCTPPKSSSPGKQQPPPPGSIIPLFGDRMARCAGDFVAALQRASAPSQNSFSHDHRKLILVMNKVFGDVQDRKREVSLNQPLETVGEFPVASSVQTLTYSPHTPLAFRFSTPRTSILSKEQRLRISEGHERSTLDGLDLRFVNSNRASEKAVYHDCIPILLGFAQFLDRLLNYFRMAWYSRGRPNCTMCSTRLVVLARSIGRDRHCVDHPHEPAVWYCKRCRQTFCVKSCGFCDPLDANGFPMKNGSKAKNVEICAECFLVLPTNNGTSLNYYFSPWTNEWRCGDCAALPWHVRQSWSATILATWRSLVCISSITVGFLFWWFSRVASMNLEDESAYVS